MRKVESDQPKSKGENRGRQIGRPQSIESINQNQNHRLRHGCISRRYPRPSRVATKGNGRGTSVMAFRERRDGRREAPYSASSPTSSTTSTSHPLSGPRPRDSYSTRGLVVGRAGELRCGVSQPGVGGALLRGLAAGRAGSSAVEPCRRSPPDSWHVASLRAWWRRKSGAANSSWHGR